MDGELQNQLAVSRELTEVLTQLQALGTRRDELVAQLTGSAPEAPKTAPKRRTRAKKTDTTEAEIAKSFGQVPDGAALFDAAVAGPPNPYEFDADRASGGQGRMIFALLGNDFAIKDELEKKAVIRGYVNQTLKADPPLTSTKDLTKQQAGDLITWLQTAAGRTDIDKLIKANMEPF